MGVPPQEGLLLVHNSLLGVNLRHRIKIGAAGKVITAFDIARMMALGADWCNSGRGFMMALGCIQPVPHWHLPHRRYHPGPGAPESTGCARHIAWPTSTATPCMRCKSWCRRPGSNTPRITAHHIVRRLSDTQVSLLSNLIMRVEPGSLLKGLEHQHKVFQTYWPLASAQSFQPCMSPCSSLLLRAVPSTRHNRKPAFAQRHLDLRNQSLAPDRP